MQTNDFDSSQNDEINTCKMLSLDRGGYYVEKNSDTVTISHTSVVHLPAKQPFHAVSM